MDPWLVLLGPTAVGKTAVSLPLAERWGAHILSVDSRQIYRGLEIGSAAPEDAARARVPHHLVGELEPEERLSAGEFGRRARQAADALRARGKRPLLVGGSGLYLQAVLGGIDPDLPADPELRRNLKHRLEAEGSQTLHGELARRDPVAAARISPRDAQRIVRALEILTLTGDLPSARRRPGTRGREPARIAILDRHREDLEERIRARVASMVEAGLEKEVRALLARGLDPRLPVLRSVGFAETIAMERGELARDAWMERIVINTRRLAKRQRTWFRSLAGAEWFSIPEGEAPERTAARVDESWRRDDAAGGGSHTLYS
jgi:tRNA dimethylallyltransferase